MPLRNGTGPNGMGPMTGRGMGPCGRGYGRGRGFGRGMGYGRGCGYGMGYGYSYVEPTADEEKAMIKDDVEALKQELEAAQKHLSELESK